MPVSGNLCWSRALFAVTLVLQQISFSACSARAEPGFDLIWTRSIRKDFPDEILVEIYLPIFDDIGDEMSAEAPALAISKTPEALRAEIAELVRLNADIVHVAKAFIPANPRCRCPARYWEQRVAIDGRSQSRRLLDERCLFESWAAPAAAGNTSEESEGVTNQLFGDHFWVRASKTS